MAAKNYYGFCGTCKYCELGDSYTFCYSTSFMCTRLKKRVKADEKPCSSYEPDRTRTNEMVAKYDR